jgi:hypothetical protein
MARRDTQLAEAITRLSSAMVESFGAMNGRLDTMNHRLDTVIDALADLRVDLNRHLVTGHGEEES